MSKVTYPRRGEGWVIFKGAARKIRFTQEHRCFSLVVTSPRDMKGERYGACFTTKAKCLRGLLKYKNRDVDVYTEQLRRDTEQLTALQEEVWRIREELKLAQKAERNRSKK